MGGLRRRTASTDRLVVALGPKAALCSYGDVRKIVGSGPTSSWWLVLGPLLDDKWPEAASEWVMRLDIESTAIISADGTARTTGLTDRVPWWSFTKTALAIATLRLVEDGLIGLDDKLPGEVFSARQLLRHESGLPDYGAIPRYHSDVAAGKRPWPVDHLLKAVEVSRSRYNPGAGWAYSNIGYLRITQLIEGTSGLNLASALQVLLFEPAHLESARLALEPDDLSDVQMGDVSGYHPGWVYHGLVVGSVRDAARLLWELAYGQLLKPASFAAMKERRSRSDAHPDPGYGLGLMLTAKDSDTHALGHSGAGPGSKIAVYAKAHRAAGVWRASPFETDPDVRVLQMLSD
jgi:CubicO group peptidase (beta-lactamase class C family)